MKIKWWSLISIIFLLLLSACGRPSITLRVLDAQTNKPIEGAIALAWTTGSHGLPGLTYNKTSEVAERVSGPDGKLTLPLFSTRTIPHIKVYKPGYVGWDNFKIYKGILFNDIIRPNIIKRENFQYKSQDIYLEQWKDEYSYMSHGTFLTGGDLPTDHKNFSSLSSKFLSTFYKYENPKQRKEEKLRNK